MNDNKNINDNKADLTDNQPRNAQLGMQRKPKVTNNAVKADNGTDNNVYMKSEYDERIQKDEEDNLNDASSYKASQMFIDEMMELAGPTLEVLRENGLDDSIQQLAAWRETMMSLGINPDNEDIRSAAIAALSMVSFTGGNADDEAPAADNGMSMPALSLILGLCENNVDAVTEYNASSGFDINPVNDDNSGSEQDENTSNANNAEHNDDNAVSDDLRTRLRPVNDGGNERNSRPIQNTVNTVNNDASKRRALPRMRPHK